MGYNAEPDEGWLRDRMETRRSARFGEFSIFPRSPTPKREAPAAEAAPEENQQVELTQEEKERNAKFQGGLKKAMKEEAKEFQKKDQKDGGEKKDKKDKKEKKEKKEGKEKKDKKDKKGSGDEAEAKPMDVDVEEEK